MMNTFIASRVYAHESRAICRLKQLYKAKQPTTAIH